MSSTLSESMLQVNTNAMAPIPNNSHESHPTDDSSNESMSDVNIVRHVNIVRLAKRLSFPPYQLLIASNTL